MIGASRDPETIGGRLFHNLVTQPFAGVVYPVHPSAHAVQGVRAYASVNDVPGDVGLAFIAVPAAVSTTWPRNVGARACAPWS